MRMMINGEYKDVAAETLNALLDELDYATAHVAVAVNHVVVPRARWSATTLNNGDEIEIITPRQGG